MFRAILTQNRGALLGVAALALVNFSCGTAEPIMRQRDSAGRSELPQISAKRLQGCFDEYRDQLPPGSWAFRPNVKVDRSGSVISVDVGEMPKTAPDFAACTRAALRDMAIPPDILTTRGNHTEPLTNTLTKDQRSALGSPAVAVVVVVALSELVFEAGAYTILFAVTVQVVAKLSEECRKARERCIDQCTDSDLPTGTYSGDPYHGCLRRCMERAGCF